MTDNQKKWAPPLQTRSLPLVGWWDSIIDRVSQYNDQGAQEQCALRFCNEALNYQVRDFHLSFLEGLDDTGVKLRSLALGDDLLGLEG
jgi:hypothetical protein